MTVDKLFNAKQRELHSHLPVGDLEVQQSVWGQTLKEVDDGALVGPTNLADIPSTYPLSRHFGLQQRPKSAVSMTS